MNSTDVPSGEITVIPPLINVATQTFPAASTAIEFTLTGQGKLVAMDWPRPGLKLHFSR